MKKLEKCIVIPESLFVKLYFYFFLNDEDQRQRHEDEIKKALKQKYHAIDKRRIYTRYKTAKSEEEKAQARQEYIDLIGLNPDFME